MKATPNYIKTLLMPTTKAPQGRKAWSIDLETVWVPFLTATNTMGDTAIPLDALGAPLRLAFDKDGSVKFSNNGRPVLRLAKPISDTVRLVRENFIANLSQYASQVAESNAEAYNEQVALQREAGEPIRAYDKAEMEKAVQLRIDLAIAEVARQKEAEAVAVNYTPLPVKEKELVTA